MESRTLPKSWVFGFTFAVTLLLLYCPPLIPNSWGQPLNVTCDPGANTVTITACDSTQIGCAGANGVRDFRIVGCTALPIPAFDTATLNLDAGDGNDSITVIAPASNGVFWGVKVNINGEAGHDNLILTSNGNVEAEVNFDGGPGNDAITLNGTAQANGEVYSPGPGLGQGTLNVNFPSSRLLAVSFANIEPLCNVLASLGLIINGTNADNAINYGPDQRNCPGPCSGLQCATISVDTLETITFANKALIAINARAGNDVIHLANPPAPTGLFNIGAGGDDPTASDTLIVNGTTNTMDTIVYTPLSPGMGLITGAGPIPINFGTMEHLTINGRQGGDQLVVNGTSNNNTFTHSPGAGIDQGRVEIVEDGIQTFLAVDYLNLGGSGDVTVDGIAGSNTLFVEGTESPDNFTVPNFVAVNSVVEVNSQIDINTQSIQTVTLDGFSGDDNYDVGADSGFDQINLAGGNPGGFSDQLTVNGTTGNDVPTLDIAANTLEVITVSSTSMMDLTGIENLKFVGNGAPNFDVMDIQNLGAPSGLNEIEVSLGGKGFIAFTQNRINSQAPSRTTWFDLTATNTRGEGVAFNAEQGPTVTYRGMAPITIIGCFGEAGYFDRCGFLGSPDNDNMIFLQVDNQSLSYALDGIVHPFRIDFNGGIVVDGGSGDDIVTVAIPDGAVLDPSESLRYDVFGDFPLASDQLVVTDNGIDGRMVVYRKSPDASAGSMQIIDALGNMAPVEFLGMEFAIPQPGTDGDLLVMKHDPFEFNNDLVVATFLGESPIFNVDPTIDPPVDVPNNIPADVDFFEVIALRTGKLRVDLFFRQISTVPSGNPGLPGGGDLDLEILDEFGIVLATGTSTDDNETAEVEVTAGETLFIGVFGKTPEVINNYSLSVTNTRAPHVDFTNADFFVSEVGPEAVITVARVGDRSGTSTVDFATGGGTAVPGVDYDPVSGTLNFAPGESTQSFIVPISATEEGSGDRSVGLTLSNPTGAELGVIDTATLIIVGSSVIVIETTTTSCNLSQGELPAQRVAWFIMAILLGSLALMAYRRRRQ